MNSSYNYADFIGMNIDPNIDHELEDEDCLHTQQPKNTDRVQTEPVNDSINGSTTDDKTTE